MSEVYTNHSLRVSACTILGETHTENEIKSISGHKSNSSLGVYKRIKGEKKEEMSNVLSKAMGLNEPTTSTTTDQTDSDQLLLQEVEHIENTFMLESSKQGPRFFFQLRFGDI